MEAILVQDGVDLAIHGIEKKSEGVIDANFAEMDKKAKSNIILNFSDEILREVVLRFRQGSCGTNLRSCT